MKLSIKNTFLVGFAFFAINAFWTFYDAFTPLMYDTVFGVSNSVRGLLMGIDNILALIVVPLFGLISDRFISKRWGKRTPYIFIGIFVGAISYTAMGVVSNLQMENLLSNFSTISQIQDATERQNIVWRFTTSNSHYFVMSVIFTIISVLFMGLSRTPAVALMPDITPKSLRSKANAIINLMGGIGGVCTLVVFTMLFKDYQSHLFVVFVVSVIIVFALLLFLSTVREPDLVREKTQLLQKLKINEDESALVKGVSNSKGKLTSLLLVLFTIFFSNFGYNAVSSHFTVYANDKLGFSDGAAGVILILAIVLPIMLIYPIAMISDKLGRRKTILIGTGIMTLSMVISSMVTSETHWIIYISFALIGLGRATITVNTLPMVLEMSHDDNIGRFTGLYYLFSMLAQAITPGLAGYLMDITSYGRLILFPYGSFFAMAAFGCMFFTKYGDVIIVKQGEEEK